MQADQTQGQVIVDAQRQGRRRAERIVIGYQKRLYDEIENRIGRWPVDLTKREVHEVVGGLLARQATLGIQLASSPGIWNGHVAPLILRTMVDTFITLAWIIEDPVDRAGSSFFTVWDKQSWKSSIEASYSRSRDVTLGRIPSFNSRKLGWILRGFLS